MSKLHQIFSICYLWPWLGNGIKISHAPLALEMTSCFSSQVGFRFSASPRDSNELVAEPVYCIWMPCSRQQITAVCFPWLKFSLFYYYMQIFMEDTSNEIYALFVLP